jgi:hypothetical protein
VTKEMGATAVAAKPVMKKTNMNGIILRDTGGGWSAAWPPGPGGIAGRTCPMPCVAGDAPSVTANLQLPHTEAAAAKWLFPR